MWKKYNERAKNDGINNKLRAEKRRKELAEAKTSTLKAKASTFKAKQEISLQKHNVRVTNVGISVAEDNISKLGNFSEQNKEIKVNSPEEEYLYDGFLGSKTPTPMRNKEIRKSLQEFDMIVDNTNIRKILKFYQIEGILDFTSKNHERLFHRTTWNNLKPTLKIPAKLPDEIINFTKEVTTNPNDMRRKLDGLIIQDSETWRYVRKIYEIFVDDFRLNQQLEDADTTERTYTSKFLLPIIDGAVACVHPRLRLQWCESKANSNIKHLKMTSALRDGRDGAQIDLVGNLNRKYDLIALEVAGPPLQEMNG